MCALATDDQDGVSVAAAAAAAFSRAGGIRHVDVYGERTARTDARVFVQARLGAALRATG